MLFRSGKITKKEPTLLYIKCASGVTYKISTSILTSSTCTLGEVVELHTTQVVREDAHLLFGFNTTQEQKVFETLIKLNGIGPSTAIAICSTLSPTEFANALTSNDMNAFVRVPGIGPKGAKRILVELGDFRLESEANSYTNDAILALESLGFKRDKIQKTILECSSTDTASLVKEALKKLK